jgi:CRISPR-associated protein Csh1
VIEAVKAIGGYVQQRSEGGDSLSTYIENPNSNGKYKYVLTVIINEVDGDYSFSHVSMDEFKYYNLYLYKKGAPNGTDATPTSKVAGNLEKTFNRFLKWFENYDGYDISADDKKTIQKMNAALVDKKDKIIEELRENTHRKIQSLTL